MSAYLNYTASQLDTATGRALAIGIVGSVDLVSGETDGEVTGLALDFTPTRCLLTVEVPDDESTEPEVIVANVWGSPTADGFAFLLLGTPGTGYKLHYHLAP